MIHTVWLITMINLVLLACITFIYIPIVLTVLRSLREKRQQSLGQEKGMEI
ncbi:hypothetical protein [Listeria fleischmannii]|uniref:hypothetical protein n=1 Tax=Listeria fleischmannii TaxID=1069827 RepID=UPI0020B7E711|nr:hypothetical protein [Listeria fleischmannii]